MSEGNFTRCFEHVDDNTESEIDEAITSAFHHVVQWLEEEDAKEVKAALERREVRLDRNFVTKILHMKETTCQKYTNWQNTPEYFR